jgi:tRNA-dihydrouridine synthase B
MALKYWFEKIPKPIIGLAPMHGFTNSAFRLKCRRFGADVTYSEMIAAEAIIRRVPKVFEMIKFEEAERPIVIQIFGSNPASMATAAKIIEDEFGPDGIDLNFGCPVQKAAKQNFGAIQLSDVNAATDIVKAISKVLDHTPLSAKMRLPDNDDAIKFVAAIKNAGVKLVAIHGRTATQKYRGQANWAPIYEIKKQFPDLYVLGNGDVRSKSDLDNKLGNLDGVLIGRAAKIRPEIFSELK